MESEHQPARKPPNTKPAHRSAVNKQSTRTASSQFAVTNRCSRHIGKATKVLAKTCDRHKITAMRKGINDDFQPLVGVATN